jgi:hypothetical protein
MSPTDYSNLASLRGALFLHEFFNPDTIERSIKASERPSPRRPTTAELRSKMLSQAKEVWDGTVHENLRETMFYL